MRGEGCSLAQGVRVIPGVSGVKELPGKVGGEGAPWLGVVEDVS